MLREQPQVAVEHLGMSVLSAHRIVAVLELVNLVLLDFADRGAGLHGHKPTADAATVGEFPETDGGAPFASANHA
jgi:hypothetical protein